MSLHGKCHVGVETARLGWMILWMKPFWEFFCLAKNVMGWKKQMPQTIWFPCNDHASLAPSLHSHVLANPLIIFRNPNSQNCVFSNQSLFHLFSSPWINTEWKTSCGIPLIFPTGETQLPNRPYRLYLLGILPVKSVVVVHYWVVCCWINYEASLPHPPMKQTFKAMTHDGSYIFIFYKGSPIIPNANLTISASQPFSPPVSVFNLV